MQVLLLLVGFLLAGDEANDARRFYRGVHVGCGGATVLLLKEQGVTVAGDDVAAFCANVAKLVWKHGVHNETTIR